MMQTIVILTSISVCIRIYNSILTFTDELPDDEGENRLVVIASAAGAAFFVTVIVIIIIGKLIV